jgi:hypothetical protein
MRPTFRKLEVKDIANLERLVAENSEGVEPGLKIVDSRLLLGQAAIDLVGLDGKGSLALIALDFSADDGLLLRVMDAYSWCLEYPDTLRRLYPMAQASSRPPRILFIVEKTTDAFLRRIKQLSFLEIDCFEFRHLEVNGTSVVYFDLVERLRKSVVESALDAPASVAPAQAVDARVEPRVEPRIEPRVEPRVEAVKAAIERPTPVESREPVSEPKPIDPRRAVAAEPIRIEPAAAAVAAPEPAAPVAAAPSAPAPVASAPASAPSVPAPVPSAPAPVPSAPAPVAEEPRVAVEVQAPVVAEFQGVKLEAAPVPVAPEPAAVTPAAPALALESIESTSRRHTNGHVPPPAVAPVPSAPVPVEMPVAAPVAAVAPPPPVAPAPAPAPVMPVEPAPAPAPAPAPPVWAKPGSQPNGTRPQFFTHATKSTAPVEAPAMVAAVAATAEPATPPAAKVGLEVDDRPELESLSFPKDGLSRQWLEFLSQLGATK